MQSSTQAMASIDKTMRSRDIKNGEVLRRHTELSARWKSIRERIARTDREIEALKRPPDPDPSEAGSVRSRTTTSSRPESQSTSMSTSESLALSTLSQSISPFKKFAARVTNGFRTPGKGKGKDKSGGESGSGEREKNMDKGKSRTTPRSAIKSMPPPAYPRVTSPINNRVMSPSRTAAHAIFSTPSLAGSALNLAGRGSSSAPPKPRWNISTKPEEDTYATVKPSPPRPSLQHSRQMSLSGRQSAMSGRQTPSTRPYDTAGMTATPKSAQRATASRPQTPHGSAVRKRPTSPSNIPGPIEIDIGPPSLQRTLATPVHGPPSLQAALSPPANDSPEQLSFLTPPKARRASHSRIPAPMFRPSRPTSPSASTSSYFPDGSASPSTMFMSAAASPIGPTSPSPFNTFGPSLSTGPFYAAGQNQSQSTLPSPLRPPGRPRAPPSSYRGATPMPTTSRSQSRPSSRASDSGRRTSLDRPAQSSSTADLTYIPHPKDPLDVELAKVANSIVHGFHIARVTPVVPGIAQGPEASAQYAFTNPVGRKVLACKLVVVEKSAPRGSLDGVQQQKRVICRVGGGWESLGAFLARSAVAA